MTEFCTHSFRIARITGILLLLVGLSACGWRPLYGDRGVTASAESQLALVEIEDIPGRIGYDMRQNLRTLFNFGGDAIPSYQLKVKLREVREGLAIEPDASITRFNFHLYGDYELVDSITGRILYQGTRSSVAAYNVVDSQFATLAAQKDAEDRAVRDLSEEIKLSLAIFLSGYDASL